MSTSGPRTALLLTVLSTLLLTPIVSAQQAERQEQPQQPTAPPPDSEEKVAAAEDVAKPTRSFFPTLFHNLGDDIRHIPRKNSLYWLAAGSGLALVMHPQDNQLNRRLRGSSFFDAAFKPGKYIGSLPILLTTAVSTYVVGRTNDMGRAQHLGMDLIEATILSEGITKGIKAIVRRQRPLHQDGTRNKGFAFPSGHASATFAFATVLQQHLGWKAALPTYSIATYVAISRLHDERHFASDVAFGAAEGIIIGRAVTWHGRNFYASPMLIPRGAGIIVNVDTQ